MYIKIYYIFCIFSICKIAVNHFIFINCKIYPNTVKTFCCLKYWMI